MKKKILSNKGTLIFFLIMYILFYFIIARRYDLNPAHVIENIPQMIVTTEGLTITIIAFMFIGTYIFVTLLKHRNAKSLSQKIARGTQIKGTIVHIKQTDIFINRVPVFAYTIDYIWNNQQEQQVVQKLLDSTRSLNINDEIPIVYDPQTKTVIISDDR